MVQAQPTTTGPEFSPVFVSSRREGEKRENGNPGSALV